MFQFSQPLLTQGPVPNNNQVSTSGVTTSQPGSGGKPAGGQSTASTGDVPRGGGGQRADPKPNPNPKPKGKNVAESAC